MERGQFLGRDLRQGRLVALPERRGSTADGDAGLGRRGRRGLPGQLLEDDRVLDTDAAHCRVHEQEGLVSRVTPMSAVIVGVNGHDHAHPLGRQRIPEHAEAGPGRLMDAWFGCSRRG